MKNLIKSIYLFLTILIFFLLLNTPTYTQETSPPPKQTKVYKLAFNGNEYFTDDQLQNMLILKFDAVFSEDQLDLDLQNIVKNYQNEGYLNCKISKVEEEYNYDSSRVSISAQITEGKQVEIGKIIFEGNKTFSSDKLLQLMYTKKGKVLEASALNQDIEQILNLYENKGYSFADISIKDISTYQDNGMQKLSITIKVAENERIKIDKVVTEGNTTTKENVILREIRLGDNKYVSKENLLDIRQHLENLGFFESVDEPKIYKYKTSTVLLLKLTEGNTNTFDGIIGYVPPTPNEESGYFTGLVNLSLRNLFGTGRRLDARWQKEIRSTQELELKYQEPWLFGYPLNANAGFLQRIQDSTYVKRTVDFKADALISKSITTSAIGHIERVIPTITNTQYQLYSIFDSRLLSAGLEIKLDTRDYVYNPTKGILYRAQYSVGQKKVYNTASFPGFDIPPNFTVQKILSDFDFYHSFFNRQTLLISLHGGEVQSPQLEDADYLRIGGNTTIRGYREEQFLASLAGWANIELRYSLSRKSFASIFYDAGYYKKPFDDITQSSEQKGFIAGAGIGLRIDTSLGIFGISYAISKGSSILDGIVHFGLINDF